MSNNTIIKITLASRRNDFKIVKITGAVKVSPDGEISFRVGDWITEKAANDLCILPNYVVTTVAYEDR